jgi:hypothetical protein
MESKKINDYLQLGALMQFLIHLNEGSPLHGEKMTIYAIKAFLNLLIKLNLQVSSRASWRLRELQKEFEKQNEETSLSKEDSKTLRETMLSIRNTVNAEVQGFEFFTTTPKRLDISKLLNDPAGLFAPEVFDSFNELTKYDITEAAKCIAFERSTAAAFHMLRATENILREFYGRSIKRGRIKSVNWGPLIR